MGVAQCTAEISDVVRELETLEECGCDFDDLILSYGQKEIISRDLQQNEFTRQISNGNIWLRDGYKEGLELVDMRYNYRSRKQGVTYLSLPTNITGPTIMHNIDKMHLSDHNLLKMGAGFTAALALNASYWIKHGKEPLPVILGTAGVVVVYAIGAITRTSLRNTSTYNFNNLYREHMRTDLDALRVLATEP